MTTFIEIPITSLPDFIQESQHFMSYKELYPDETTYLIPSTMLLNSLEINSNEDFYRIIDVESQYLFSKNDRITILRNIDLYWQNNPNASGIILPTKNVSHFGNQVNALFDNMGSYMIAMKCMKHNYVELFEYLFERDGEQCLISTHPMHTTLLIYFAVINGHREILLKGIELGSPVNFKLLEPAILKGYTDILHILIDEIKKQKVEINMHTFYEIMKNGNRTAFALLLDNFVTDINEFCFRKDNGRVIYSAMQHIEILKELVSRNINCTDKTFAKGLIEYCVNNNKSIEMINLVGTHFGYTFADHYNEKYIFKIKPNIPEHVIKGDNLDMYELLRSAGFLVTDDMVNIAYTCKNTKITPGLLKKHISETPFEN